MVHQENDIFCTKSVKNLQDIWCYVDYSLILQAKFAERAKGSVTQLVLTP
ncbi:MAG: hypothetical protein ACI35P_10760 [Bacillus sp. (in: firmicutes)]